MRSPINAIPLPRYGKSPLRVDGFIESTMPRETTREMIAIDPTITVTDLLNARVRDDGDHIFCRWRDQKFSYRDLGLKVNAIANGLIAKGIRSGDRVAI